MATTTQSANKVTKVEVAVLGTILAAGLTLLLPSLPASREAARANLCGRRLHWLDLATNAYIAKQSRLQRHLRGLPDHIAWPTELLSELQTQAGVERHAPGVDVFAMARPMYLTCPSRPDVKQIDGKPQLTHYTLVVDRQEGKRWEQAKWKYRDAPLDPDHDKRRAWYIGDEMSWEAAEQQLKTSRGPHSNGTFLESDGQGNAVVRSLVH
jgi:hypothetical protein